MRDPSLVQSISRLDEYPVGATLSSVSAPVSIVFDAHVQRSKNRLVAIPARVQRLLGLTRRAGDRLIHVSLRRASGRRWGSHYFKLTEDNEFSIPSDVTGVSPGDRIEVKVHQVLAAAPIPESPGGAGARVLLRLADRSRPGWRRDGSTRLDDYLKEAVHGESGLR